jgi:hypothetical protein
MLLSLVRRRLSAWFHKPPDTMLHGWHSIIDQYVLQPVAQFLHYFYVAASQDPDGMEILDRLTVVWIWLNKHLEAPEHEYIIIETVDSVDGTTRLFVIDRTAVPLEKPTTSRKNDPKRPDNRSYEQLGNFQGISKLIPSSVLPSRATTPLSAMEEGLSTSAFTSTSTPISYPPISLQPPDLSLADTITVSATKSAQMISDSFDKKDAVPALDRVRGEHAALSRRYHVGKNIRQIKPRNLKLFEFIILVHTLHLFAPDYSRTKWNCYWFANRLIDAIIEIFGLEDGDLSNDEIREGRYTVTSLDSHLAGASGRWKGWKIIQTNLEELSKVVYAFKREHTKVVSEVRISSKFLFLTKI